MLSPLRKANVFKGNICWCREKNNHITCYVAWRRISEQGGLGYVTLGAGKVKVTCISFSSADWLSLGC